jgi:hypothetical protein
MSFSQSFHSIRIQKPEAVRPPGSTLATTLEVLMMILEQRGHSFQYTELRDPYKNCNANPTATAFLKIFSVFIEEICCFISHRHGI